MGMGQQLRWGVLPVAGCTGRTARRLSASEASVEQEKRDEEGVLQLLKGLEMVLPLQRVPVDKDVACLPSSQGRHMSTAPGRNSQGPHHRALAARLSFPQISIFTNQAGT